MLVTISKSSSRPDVEPIVGEPFRVYVRSRSNPSEQWLVDVEDDWCGCQQHEFRVQPRIERGEPFERCWHLQRAREFLLDKIIASWRDTYEHQKIQSVGEAVR